MEEVAEIAAAVKNVPELRFPEFKGEWEETRLGDIATFSKGKGISKADITENGKLECIRYGELYTFYGEVIEKIISRTNISHESLILSEENDVIIPASGESQIDIAKASCVLNKGIALGGDLNIIKTKLNGVFLSYYLNNRRKKDIAKLAQGVSVVHLYSNQLKGLKLNIPTSSEQQKIASFLSAADEKIQHLSKKKGLLERYKKAVMQQIFSQQIRFKDDNGNDFSEWEEKKLGQVFERVKTKNAENNKNVLTISAQHGLINQEDFFNKSVSAENVTGYYLLHKGDFAYNKSYSKGYPMGAIKRLTKYDKGVVSTLYICFRIKDESSEEYFEQYFNSGYLNSELHKIAQEGARNHGLLNMSVVEFFSDIKLPRPCEGEQIKIANFLTSIDNKLNYTSKQLEQTRQFKKGILQQMFV